MSGPWRGRRFFRRSLHGGGIFDRVVSVFPMFVRREGRDGMDALPLPNDLAPDCFHGGFPMTSPPPITRPNFNRALNRNMADA